MVLDAAEVRRVVLVDHRDAHGPRSCAASVTRAVAFDERAAGGEQVVDHACRGGLGVDAHERLGAGRAQQQPRVVGQQELDAVGADDRRAPARPASSRGRERRASRATNASLTAGSSCRSTRLYSIGPVSASRSSTSSPRPLPRCAIISASMSAMSSPSRSRTWLGMPMPPRLLAADEHVALDHLVVDPLEADRRGDDLEAEMRAEAVDEHRGRERLHDAAGHALVLDEVAGDEAMMRCGFTKLPWRSTAPMRSASPSVTKAASRPVVAHELARPRRCAAGSARGAGRRSRGCARRGSR